MGHDEIPTPPATPSPYRAFWVAPRPPEVQTPRIAVGTMNFGKRTPADEATRIIHAAVDRGLVFFDTANVYNDGESEHILGRALVGKRERCLVATKVGLGRVGGKAEGLGAEAIARAIDGSLARLGTTYVDVYYLHAPDAKTPIEETVHAMHRVLASGKARAWGVSNFASWQVLEMARIADEIGMPRPVIGQVIYNTLIREIEIEYLAFARRYGVHTTVFNPLAGGLLSGRYTQGTKAEKGTRFDGNSLYMRRYWSARMFEHIARLAPIAERAGRSLVELAYGWLATKPGVDSVLVGPVTLTHLESAISATSKPLEADVAQAVDAVYRDHAGTDTHYVR